MFTIGKFPSSFLNQTISGSKDFIYRNTPETMKTLYVSFLKFLIFIASFISFGSSVKAQTVLIEASSSWKYLDDGSDQGTAWRATNFNDAGWNSGAATLGYGCKSSAQSGLNLVKNKMVFPKIIKFKQPWKQTKNKPRKTLLRK